MWMPTRARTTTPSAADRCFRPLVIQRERGGLDGTLEQQQEAVGLVDLAALVLFHQRAREAIVLADDVGGALVAHALDQRGGIGDVADHQRAQLRRGHAAGAGMGFELVDFGGHGNPPRFVHVVIPAQAGISGQRTRLYAESRRLPCRRSASRMTTIIDCSTQCDHWWFRPH
jgi:hypothetical protein